MRFFFALSAALRHSCCLGLIDRPLCLAVLVSAVSGAWAQLIPLGIILELFWLDVVPLGSIVPPLNVFSFWLMVPLCLHFSWEQPAPMLVPLLLAVICAYGGAWLERWLRVYRNTLLGQVHRWATQTGQGCPPARAVVHSAWQRFFLQLFFFSVCYIMVLEFTLSLQARGMLLQLDALTWPVVYAVSALGALLSLRTRRAYALLCVLLALLGIAHFMS